MHGAGVPELAVDVGEFPTVAFVPLQACKLRSLEQLQSVCGVDSVPGYDVQNLADDNQLSDGVGDGVAELFPSEGAVGVFGSDAECLRQWDRFGVCRLRHMSGFRM